MCQKLSTLIQQVYEEKLNAKSAELKQLQYQINPHFLYNCFFLTYRMAMMHDEDGVIKLTKHLGNYYQFVTRSSSDDVPLIKELNHVKEYIEIQSVRFNNRIFVKIEELPKVFDNLLVPRLILQPVIENAYSHGLKNKVKNGIINISFSQKKNVFSISVEDNGNELTSEILMALEDKLLFIDNSDEITGLLNVQRRLKIKYGELGGISVSRGELGGLKITEKIILEES
ncbi:MAG TPA: histidine kinase [Ruminiclostridium sp.]